MAAFLQIGGTKLYSGFPVIFARATTPWSCWWHDGFGNIEMDMWFREHQLALLPPYGILLY
jgi:hypothetical protein